MNKDSEIGTTFQRAFACVYRVIKLLILGSAIQHSGICPNQKVQNFGCTVVFISGLFLIIKIRNYCKCPTLLIDSFLFFFYCGKIHTQLVVVTMLECAIL